MSENLYAQLARRANELGFAAVAAAALRPIDDWREAAFRDPRPHWRGLTADPAACLPGAVAGLLLAYPYSPYRDRPGEPMLDAYYVVSNAAHRAARGLADELVGAGFSALLAPVPIKPLAERSGLGRYGRNGLVSVGRWGTRVALQLILTDAPLPTTDVGDRPGFAPECADCRRCVAACPTGALAGDGRVNMDRCLRSLAGERPMPEEFRPYVRSVQGCDLCQAACPRNAGVAQADMPEELDQLARLSRLLAGDAKGLVPWIGGNYARKGRLQAAAALAAANLGRADCLGALAALECSALAPVRECAAWAVRRLAARA
ncbi:MAG: epoxyqueuosine reductase [Clostridiales bacterium]|nr:epoxyqueuosine reductase [Clostridiales bacterium]